MYSVMGIYKGHTSGHEIAKNVSIEAALRVRRMALTCGYVKVKIKLQRSK